MATVYKALDTRLEAHVAVKVVRMEYIPPSALDQTIKRFEREAKSLARLTHPNIVKVMDYGDHDGNPFLVMEYLSGGTLKQRIKGGAIPWQEAVGLLMPITQALGYAHKQNLIHRDVKSSNIMFIETGQPMLTDFGMAKLFNAEKTSELTNTGMGVGTPEYMAPEQWMGRVSVRSDIYSLGVVLYETITEKKPYTADTPAALLLKQANDPLPSPRRYARDLPEKVEKVLFKALAKEEKRYQSMGEFSSALESLLGGPSHAIESIAVNSRPQQYRFKQNDRDATVIQGLTHDDLEWIANKPGVKPGIKNWWIGVIGAVCLVIAGMIISWLSFFHPPATPVPDKLYVVPTTFVPLSLPNITGASLPNSGITISPQTINQLKQVAIGNIGMVNDVSFSADGKILAAASESRIYLYNTITLKELRVIKTDRPITDIAISPDGQILAFAASDGALQLWHISDGTSYGTLEGFGYDVAFSPDGQTLAAGMNNGSVWLWNAADGTPLRALEGHTSYVFSVAFSPDGQTLASGSGDNTMRLWRFSDGALLRVFEGHMNLVNSVAFSPDGQTLASGSVDNTVRLWNVTDGTLLRTFEGHTSYVNSVGFSPDGLLLVSGGRDGTLRLWDVTNGTLLNTLKVQPDNVSSVGFSPDGQMLASGSEDKTLRLWGIIP